MAVESMLLRSLAVLSAQALNSGRTDSLYHTSNASLIFLSV